MKLRVKMWKHFCLINRHKWNVFKLMCRAGRPLQGALHDMSKFTPTEFIESAKYYTGTHSPIDDARKAIGYSKAWQHHKAHNKHHYFYWIDSYQEHGGVGIIMPEKYCVEMFCDMIAASKVYKGVRYKNSDPLHYFVRQNYGHFMHPVVWNFLGRAFGMYGVIGEKWINKKKLHKLYRSVLRENKRGELNELYCDNFYQNLKENK